MSIIHASNYISIAINDHYFLMFILSPNTNKNVVLQCFMHSASCLNWAAEGNKGAALTWQYNTE